MFCLNSLSIYFESSESFNSYTAYSSLKRKFKLFKLKMFKVVVKKSYSLSKQPICPYKQIPSIKIYDSFENKIYIKKKKNPHTWNKLNNDDGYTSRRK